MIRTFVLFLLAAIGLWVAVTLLILVAFVVHRALPVDSEIVEGIYVVGSSTSETYSLIDRRGGDRLLIMDVVDWGVVRTQLIGRSYISGDFAIDLCTRNVITGRPPNPRHEIKLQSVGLSPWKWALVGEGPMVFVDGERSVRCISGVHLPCATSRTPISDSEIQASEDAAVCPTEGMK